ncbi:glycosyltransferase family 4 protein [Rhodoferax sp. GW822-FHT02A01]|uniref:glycosyltransferase family 4 protein n=1 Tax=Rhodoferax sp. GW822-FHT02A01 TaxID=3141537 RepID=UPI00315CBD3D
MKIALSTIGKFHTFDLARELHARGVLAGIYSGYPQFKLRNEGIPPNLIHTFPWVHSSYMAFPWKHRLSTAVVQAWENINAITFGRWLQNSVRDCDAYVGLSGSTLQAGRAAQARGAKYVCDRGSAHIRVQDQLLREEHALWGLPYAGIDPRAIAREEAEYSDADAITVPSTFALRSFLAQGVCGQRVKLLPYGVNLTRFEPVGKPVRDEFNVLFVGAMSLQKGIPYLVQAFNRIQHPKKTLTFAGSPSVDLIQLLSARNVWPQEARVLGHVPQTELKQLMSASHVLVLPSIQEGFGMVLAQAMACACPVIASENTGADDLFTNAREGFIVPIRQVEMLTERLQRLADDPDERTLMGERALQAVKGIGGWNSYGDNAMAIYRGLLSHA